LKFAKQKIAIVNEKKSLVSLKFNFQETKRNRVVASIASHRWDAIRKNPPRLWRGGFFVAFHSAGLQIRDAIGLSQEIDFSLAVISFSLN
jgi:hypothetical protein